MNKNASSHKEAIGVFDSGIGGLTVANAIHRHLPNEDLIYFGDTAHLPYGDKSADSIKFYALGIAKFLLDKKCKAIVIACNSASSAAYNVLLDFFKDKAIFVNVVDPLVKAVAKEDYNNVGIIATKATTASRVYPDRFQFINPELNVHALATPLLAPMIEEGFANGKVSDAVIESYLSNPTFENIEALLLACTHYPLIKENIYNYFKGKVEVYDSTDVVALDLQRKLKKQGLLNDSETPGSRQFFVSEFTQSFEETTRLFWDGEVDLEPYSIW